MERASVDTVPILLLKTRSSPTDGYHEYFSNVEGVRYIPEFVPVLEHHLKEDSLGELLDLIQSGAFRAEATESPASRYGGIIFTSQRAVEAFTTVVENLKRTSHSLDVLLPADLPLYVVGPVTARGLRALGLECPVVGEDSGNGEILANFILEHYNKNAQAKASTEGTNLPVLFLVGEQRRDVIPKTLQSSSLEPSEKISVHELVVYETSEMKDFRSNFLTTWSKCRPLPQSWVVVFSPTGCKAMLESLDMLDETSGKVKENIEVHRPLIATIGPTTRDFLVREFGCQPEVCARKPNPEGLGQGVTAFMQSKTVQ